MAKCISPITLKSTQIAVPCGKCLPCMKNRASNWSFRLNQEAKRANTAYFITLTYDTDHVPITKNGFMSLKKEDYQLFFARLRKSHSIIIREKCDKNKRGFKEYHHYPNGELKYYAVGEYGGNFNRPHYHVIVYNLDLEKFLNSKGMAKMFIRGDLPLDGKVKAYSDDWPFGHVTIGRVTEASIGYCLIYISKGREVPKHQRDDRLPEFSLMSKKIGDNYITDKMKKWHHADLNNRYYVHIKTSKGSAKAPLPRYYKDKLYTKWQQTKIAYHLQKQELDDWNKMNYQQREDYYKEMTSRNERLNYRKLNKK